MSARAVHDLPVPILTDDELIEEYTRTFNSVTGADSRVPDDPKRAVVVDIDSALRRNTATMGELLKRGFKSSAPCWQRTETA